MSNLPSPFDHTPARTARERTGSDNRRAWTAHPRPQLISDGVMAGYIHDISVRRANGTADSWPGRRRGDQR